MAGFQRLDKTVAMIMNITRADARRLIFKGQVLVDGDAKTKPEYKLDPEKSALIIDGKEYSYTKNLYIMMDKPEGCVCTEYADERSVLRLIDDEIYRRDLFCVGRLDVDTTGLLIITNDGELAHKIITPKAAIYKTYLATLSHPLTSDAADILTGGVTLKNGEECIADKVVCRDENEVEITVHTGKYHQVKRMFAAIGNEVVKLRRTAIGGLNIPDDMTEGESRLLDDEMIGKIFEK